MALNVVRSDAPPQPLEPQVADPQPKAKRPKPAKILPTERISFQKQLDMLRAYAVAYDADKQPVSSLRLSSLIGMAVTTVPHATPFFADVGLIQRVDNGYVPSADVMNYRRAHSWSADDAPSKLALLLGQTWFAGVILPRLALRGSLDEREAISLLAEAAGATPEHKTALELLLEFLRAAGLIERDSGLIKKPAVDPIAHLAESPAAMAPAGTAPSIASAAQLFPPTALQQQPTTTEQQLLEILDPDNMSEGEQDAVWTLLKYLKRKGRNTKGELT